MNNLLEAFELMEKDWRKHSFSLSVTDSGKLVAFVFHGPSQEIFTAEGPVSEESVSELLGKVVRHLQRYEKE